MRSKELVAAAMRKGRRVYISRFSCGAPGCERFEQTESATFEHTELPTGWARVDYYPVPSPERDPRDCFDPARWLCEKHARAVAVMAGFEEEEQER